MTIDPHFRRMMDDEAAARARHERDLPPVRPSAHMADLSDLAASDAQPYAREEFRGEDVSRRIMVDVAASKVIVPLDIWSRICDTFNAAAAVERGVGETPVEVSDDDVDHAVAAMRHEFGSEAMVSEEDAVRVALRADRQRRAPRSGRRDTEKA